MSVNDEEKIALGQRVRSARLKAGVSGRALGVKIGLSPTAVNKIEMGRSGASIETVAAIARVLNVKFELLVLGDTPMMDPPGLSGHSPAKSGTRSATTDHSLALVVPKAWPEGLREFIASDVGGELGLSPIEVPLLAALCKCTDYVVPTTEAEWVALVWALRRGFGERGFRVIPDVSPEELRELYDWVAPK